MRSYLWVLEWVLELIMAGEKLLTDAQCKAAKPKEKIYYLNDGSGLRLRVSPLDTRGYNTGRSTTQSA